MNLRQRLEPNTARNQMFPDRAVKYPTTTPVLSKKGWSALWLLVLVLGVLATGKLQGQAINTNDEWIWPEHPVSDSGNGVDTSLGLQFGDVTGLDIVLDIMGELEGGPPPGAKNTGGIMDLIGAGFTMYELANQSVDQIQNILAMARAQNFSYWGINNFRLMTNFTSSGVAGADFVSLTVTGYDNDSSTTNLVSAVIPSIVRIKHPFTEALSRGLPVRKISFIGQSARISSLTIGSEVNSISPIALDIPTLTNIVVGGNYLSGDGTYKFFANSSYFSAQDGVLFNSDKSELVRFPMGKGGNYVVPSSVTRIADNAFWGCSNLTSLVIPSNVVAIGFRPFEHSGLQVVYFGGNPPANDGSVFFGATNCAAYYLTGFNGWGTNGLPFNYGGIQVQLYNPFSYTVANGSVTITGGSWNYPTTPTVLIPSAIAGLPVRAIGNEAFDFQPGLVNVVVPNSVTSIGEKAFQRCVDLESIQLSTSLTNIGESAFERCQKLTRLRVPDGVRVIPDGFVATSTNLTSVILGTNVTSIGYGAFNGCENLFHLNIPATLNSIGETAFHYCGNLWIDVDYRNLSYSSYLGTLFNKTQTRLLHGNSRLGGSYNVPSTVVEIDTAAFYGANVSTVFVPASVKRLGANVFENCENLLAVYFGDSPPAAPEYSSGFVFKGSTNAVVYRIPQASGWGATYSGAEVRDWVPYVYATNNLAITLTAYSGPGGNVVLPGSFNGMPVTSIQPGFFSIPGAISSLVLPDGLTSIPNNAFAGLVNLTNLVFGNNVTNIGSAAFSGCSSLGNLVIPNTVKSIGSSAFSGCGITNLVIGSGLTSLSAGLFSGCSLENVTIPATITQIGAGAFSGNSRLAYAVIPGSVRSLGGSAFANCWNLEQVFFQGDAPIADGTALNTGYNPAYTFLGTTFYKRTLARYLPGTTGWEQTFGGAQTDLLPLYYTNRNGAITITRYSDGSQPSDFPIFSSINGVPVIGIADYAFADCRRLTGVIIPAGISSIGAGPFMNCTNLAKLVVSPGNPAYVSVGNVLYNSRQTELIQYPGGLTGQFQIPSTVTHIGARAFYGSRITQMTIPVGVTQIGSEAFAFCRGLTALSVTGGNSAYSSFDGVLFNSAQNLLIQYPGARGGSYTVPSTVTTIGTLAFAGSKVTSVVIPNSVTSIAGGALGYCKSLLTVNVQPGSSQFLSYNGVLHDASGTAILAYPAGLFTSYKISNAVTVIGFDAFAGASLISVTVPSGVWTIGSRAFAGCTNLVAANFFGNAPSTDGTAFTNSPYATVHYLASGSGWGATFGGAKTRLNPFAMQETGNNTLMITGYQGIAPWFLAIPGDLFGSTVTAIGDDAFTSQTNISYLSIPETVSSIGEYAFSGCVRLESLQFRNAVNLSIGYGSFAGCVSLKTVNFMGAPTTIGDYAFYNCRTLDWVTFGQVTSIGDYAFNGCNAFKFINIGDSVTSIGAYAFANFGTSQINLPASVTYLGSRAFANGGTSTGRISVYTSGNPPASDGTAFANAWATIFYTPGTGWGPTYNGMQTMEFPSMFETRMGPDGAIITGLIHGYGSLVIPPYVWVNGSLRLLAAIGNKAFAGNLSLTNVTLPSTLKSIGDAAFLGCSNLVSAALPQYLLNIGDSAFRNCVRLEGVVIPQTVTNIGTYAFAGCPGEINLTFGSGLINLGYYSFNGWTNLQKVFFGGNGLAGNASIFGGASPTIYVLPGSVGWGATYAGRPVSQWVQYYYTLYTNGLPQGQNSESVLFGPDDAGPSDNTSGLTNVYAIIKGYAGSQRVVTIPSQIKGWPVTTLASSALANRNNLDSVILPNSVTYIGFEAFKYTHLTNIVLSTNLTEISSRAFYGSGLQNIVLPDSLTNLDSSVFELSGITNVVLPKNLVSIGESAFYGCPMQSIVLPQSLQTIGGFAFASSGLTNIVFPRALTSIGNGAFQKCPMPDPILIPANVTFIGGGAFSPVINGIMGGLGGAVYFEGNAPTSDPDWGAPFQSVYNTTVINGITINAGPGIAYYDPTTFGWGDTYSGLKTVPWNPYSYTIEDDSITITGYRGSGGAVKLPDTLGGFPVTSISAYAFATNLSLTSITVPASITNIGTGAFAESTNLSGIYFMGNEPAVGAGVFQGSPVQVFYLNTTSGWGTELSGVAATPFAATGALTVNINPNNIGAQWQVDGGSFHSSGFTATNLSVGSHIVSFSTVAGWQKPNNVTLQVYPFQGTLITLPYSFVPFTYITNIDGTLTITGYQGSGGTVYIPEHINGASVTAIAPNAFANSTITSIVIPDHITSVGTNAFAGCQNLVSATISSAITNLSGNVFLNCSNLVSVFFNGNAPETDGTIFTGASNVNVYYLTDSTGWTNQFNGLTPQLIPYEFDIAPDNTVTITAYHGNESSLEIPQTIGGLSVGGIGAYVFDYNLNLTAIKIPDSVKSIDFQAFLGCSNLQSVVLGTNIQEIGYFAFAQCTSLSSINFPDSLQQIYPYAFRYCGSLTNIDLGEGLINIHESAFERCTSLAEVTFGQSLTNIGFAAFTYCQSLTNLTFPEGLISIQASAFSSCTNLVELNFNANLEFIYDSAFQSCLSLTNIVLPPKIYLGSRAFAFCPQLQTVLFTGTRSLMYNPTLLSPFYNNSSTVVYYPTEAAVFRGDWLKPDTTTTDYRAAVAYSVVEGSARTASIDHHAGNGSSFSVPSVIAGYPVTAIASNAFSSYINVLDIGPGILSIGAMPNVNFGVNTINVDSGNPNYSVLGGVLFDKAQTTLIKIPTFLHSSSSYTIPSTVTAIADYAFADSRVRYLTLSPNITSIGEGAFTRAQLVSLKNPAPDNLIFMGQRAFEGASYLTNFVTGNNLAAIQAWSFANCTQLSSISLGLSVGTIGTGAFSNCVNLASVQFPSGFSSIGDGAFANCQSLVTLTLPAGLPTGTNYYSLQLGSGVFAGASALESAYFLGNRPLPDYGNTFSGADQVTVYVPQDSLGWGSTIYSGRPVETYAPFGSLKVTFSPNLALGSWRVDGGVWQTNGATVSQLSTGSHTVSFATVDGYFTPQEKVVEISNLSLSTTSGLYALTPLLYTVDSGVITVTGFRELNAEGFLIIPPDINGIPVKNIGPGAFFNKTALVGVIMADTVTNIGTTSFMNCTNLRHLVLSTNLLSIGNSAFWGCKNLLAVQLPDSVTNLNSGAFVGCTSLSSVQFGSGISTVGYDIFNNCPSIANLFFTGNAPSDASWLTTFFPQLSTLYYLEDTTGWGAVTSGNPTEWSSLYKFNTNDGGGITITQSPQSYGHSSVIIPPRINGLPVNQIGEYAFRYAGMQSILLPSSVRDIQANAFNSCGMREIFIQSTVTNIGNMAFASGWSLANLFVDPANPNYSSESGILYNKTRTELICAGPGWQQNDSEFSRLAVPEGVVKIAEKALFDLSYVSRISLPASLSLIGNQALSAINSLTNIFVDPLNEYFVSDRYSLFNKSSTLLIQYFGGPEISRYLVPASVKFIGEGAFKQQYDLSSLIIPPTLVSIGAEAFAEGSIPRLVVPNSVTNIGAGAFMWSSITNVVLPIGLTSIDSNLFMGCQSLTSIEIPGGVTKIGNSAFHFSGLTHVELPGSLTNIGRMAFLQSRLESLVIPDNCVEIGPEAFAYCNNLRTVKLGAGVTTIGVGGFMECRDIRELTFNNNLATISEKAFYNCWNLYNIVLPSTLNTLGSNAFWGSPVQSALFLGNAPSIDQTPFNSGTIYYYTSTEGWGSSFSGRPAVAYDSMFYYENNDDDTVRITGTDVSHGDIRIPSEYNGHLVTSIDSFAFQWNTYDTVFIPGTITNIAVDAFIDTGAREFIVDPSNTFYTNINGSLYDAGVTTLLGLAETGSFHLPSTVTNLNLAFLDMYSDMVSISVDPENPYFASVNGVLFNKQTNVLIRFPRGAAVYGTYNVPETVTTIGSYAFYAGSLAAIKVPASVTNIEVGAFSYNGDLTAVYFEGPAPEFEDGAFESIYNGIVFYLAPATEDGFLSTGMPVQDWLSLFTWETNGGTSISITGYNDPGNYSYVMFPSTGINGLPIHDVGTAFSYVSLTGIKLPDGITNIADEAFYYSELYDLALPANLISIGESAFYGCNLENVNFPSNVAHIGPWAFTENYFTNVVLPASLKTLGAGAFSDNDIFTVTLNNGLESIGEETFAYNYLEQIAIPNTVTNISSRAFKYNYLTHLVIPNSITEINFEAFSDNDLFSLILPSGLLNIHESAFNYNELEELVIPTGVTNIGPYAFSDNYIYNLELPDSLLSIGEGAFLYGSLETLIIPANVATIGNSAFAYNWINAAYFLGNAPADDDGTALEGNDDPIAWYLPGATGWGSTYGGVAAQQMSEASVANNSDGTVTITSFFGVGAVTVPAIVNSKSVSTIGSSAFANTGNQITSITLADGISSISAEAFFGCTTVTSIYIPASVTNIDVGAFAGCLSLTNIVVAPENPVFSSLNGILFDKTQTTLLASGAGLNGSYVVPEGVTSIGASAFIDCTGLTNIVFPSTLISIEEMAFAFCEGLTTLNIPAGATSLGTYSFGYCINLRTVYFEGDAPVDNDGTAFAGDSNATVYFPSSAVGYSSTFGGVPAFALLPPSASPFTVYRVPGTVVEIFLADLANHWNDPNQAYPVKLGSIRPSTNLVSVIQNTSSLIYNNADSVRDQIIYTITNNLGIVGLGYINIVPVDSPPVITIHPRSRNINAGSKLSLLVQAYGTQPLGYQWFHNDAPMPGATNVVFKITDFQAHQTGSYYVIVSNAIGSVTSSNAIVHINQVGPAILRQPLSFNVSAGSTVIFNPAVSGTDPRVYQWYFGSDPVLGGTNASLTLTNVQQVNVGSYSMLVSNELGVASTDNATLNVTDIAPVITLQPQSAKLISGDDYVLKAEVRGTTPMSTQWMLNGQPIPGATNTTLALDDVQPSHSGNYTVVFSNYVGVTGSIKATVLVNVPANITQGPIAQSVPYGGSVTFTVQAVGSGKVTYQWLLNDAPIEGATRSQLSLTGLNQSAAGNYSVLVSNLFGYTLSSNALLSVIDPIILSNPLSRTNMIGTAANFKVDVRGSNPLAFQWFFDNAPISDGTNSTLLIRNVQETNGGNYFVTISNSSGMATSTIAQLVLDTTFVSASGTYDGLFYETNEVAHHSSGYINISIFPSGSMKGSLYIEGGRNPFSATFNSSGSATITLLRSNATTLNMALQLDLTNQTGSLVGTVTDGSWTAELLADRSGFSETNTTSLSGRYTIALPGSTNAGVPLGYGYGLIVLESNGVLKASGATSDGAAWTQTVRISANGDWPFYSSLYGGKGSMLGWLKVQESPVRNVSGNFSWIKTSGSEAYYPQGFSNVTEVVGSGYETPAIGVPGIILTNASIILEGGDLLTALSDPLTWIGNNKPAVSTPNSTSIRLKVVTASGFFGGSFIHPVSGETNAINGVLLQNSSQAAGFFLGPNESGRVLITD